MGPALLLSRDATTRNPLLELTERELQILRLMSEGLSNLAIRERLVLGEKTIETHIRGLLRKLDVPVSARVHRRVLAVRVYLKWSSQTPQGRP